MKQLLRALGSRLPTLNGSVSAPVHGKATIRRDAHGVAYIEAQNDHDAFFSLGFVQGQDRAFQLELFLRIARGTLSALVGKDAIDADRLSRRIGFFRIGKAQLAGLDAQSLDDLEAFTRGLNFGAGHGQRPHELKLLGARSTPWEPADVLAVLQFMTFGLSSNWDAELARLHVLQSDGPEALLALEAADPALLERDARALGRLASDIELLQAAEQFAHDAAQATSAARIGAASNNWVLAPSRTVTGRPLLACDPHLAPTIPAPWHLAHLRTPEWALSGAFFVGQPHNTYGHNDALAWGVTSGHSDNTDLFVEKLGPGGETALRGDQWVKCTVREERIEVRGAPPVIERVVETPTGPVVTPVVRAGGTALSLRGTWMAVRPIRAYQLYRAKTVHEGRQCFESWPAEVENRLFADTQGNIAWQLGGDLPVRKKGHGLLPMPAWDDGAGWEKEPLPFEKLPHAVNPAAGFLATANAAPPKTEAWLGADWLDGARHRRIHELLEAKRGWTLDEAQAMQIDRTNIYWRDLKGPLLAAIDPPPTGGENAARLLKGFQGVVGPGSCAASVFELVFASLMVRAVKAKAPRAWRQAIGEGLNDVLEHGIMGLRRPAMLVRLLLEQPEGWFRGGWREEIRGALVDAERQLTEAAGPDPHRWTWGTVRPLWLKHAMHKVPVLKNIFDVGPIAGGGDASTLWQAGSPFDHPLSNTIGVANLRMVLDVGNWEGSRWVLLGGQSGNPLSPHYADQVPRWEKGEVISMAWSPAAVQSAAVATLQLTP